MSKKRGNFLQWNQYCVLSIAYLLSSSLSKRYFGTVCCLVLMNTKYFNEKTPVNRLLDRVPWALRCKTVSVQLSLTASLYIALSDLWILVSENQCKCDFWDPWYNVKWMSYKVLKNHQFLCFLHKWKNALCRRYLSYGGINSRIVSVTVHEILSRHHC